MIAPDIDPNRSPADWLARGLKACGPHAGRLRELLKRAAEVDPRAALDPSWANLLAAGTAVDLAGFVADVRWRSARRLQRWVVITADVADLRRWLPEVSPAAWVRLLLLAAENLTWATGRIRDDRHAYRTAAEQTAHDHVLDIDVELSRFEYADAVTNGLRQRGWAGISEDGLGDLLRDFWDDRGADFAARLLAFAARLARVPEAALVRLDSVYQLAPAVLGLFWEILGGHQIGWPDPPAAFAAAGFLATSRWANYPEFRVKLLAFCLRERLSPTVVARVIEHRPEYVLPGTLPLGVVIASDWPLLATYRTCEVGWD